MRQDRESDTAPAARILDIAGLCSIAELSHKYSFPALKLWCMTRYWTASTPNTNLLRTLRALRPPRCSTAARPSPHSAGQMVCAPALTRTSARARHQPAIALADPGALDLPMLLCHAHYVYLARATHASAEQARLVRALCPARCVIATDLLDQDIFKHESRQCARVQRRQLGAATATNAAPLLKAAARDTKITSTPIDLFVNSCARFGQARGLTLSSRITVSQLIYASLSSFPPRNTTSRGTRLWTEVGHVWSGWRCFVSRPRTVEHKFGMLSDNKTDDERGLRQPRRAVLESGFREQLGAGERAATFVNKLSDWFKPSTSDFTASLFGTPTVVCGLLAGINASCGSEH
ncbi:hypothetical protein GGX14DRAFT_666471 [Mycena pura]|uniref:Uncharacterized protein n=1 Tax=Mycena pura TaxID=153505 RepID=A0AAD6UYM9_9AGAR|nr:hypothetical protein GGX14DRAFT_666471 [Mycena pura]